MLSRSGSGLAEMLVAAVGTAILASAMLGLLASQARLAASLAGRIEARDALMLASTLLTAELRSSRPGTDIQAVATDTLAHRAFRALAVVCDTTDGGALVSSSGVRLPDPAKDSVIVIGRGGEQNARATTVTAASHTCGDTVGRVLFIRLEQLHASPGDVLLFFEPGSYHLHDRALRWRAGAAGRQPLTAEVIRTGASAFTRTADGIHLLLTAPLDAPRPGVDLRIRSLQPIEEQP